ncbi:MAG: nucleoside triphosphate pyrophosphohydrolase [Chitinophagia bacterium]|nr:nucleoside triphosphate pyrophosphohydrolase [Chitinophagia bacterium]
MPYATSINRLLTIMDTLRERCPWDRKQTIHTLRPQTLEEIYELAETINDEDWQGLREELGDLLLHIVFYSKIGAEQGQFTFGEVVEGVCNKLVNRHPHIYSNVRVNDEEEVKQNWERIKQAEGKKSILSGIPQGMPAMIKALRLQEKTRKVGFEWDHIGQVKDKVNEEMAELEQAIASTDADKIEDELGDVFFALINYARFLNTDPEKALERTNRKFMRRFQAIEELAAEQGKTLHDMNLDEMDALWNQVKARE